MPYRMILNLSNGTKIESPYIASNKESKFGWDDRRIEKEIRKTGNSMVKRLDNVVNFECVFLGF